MINKNKTILFTFVIFLSCLFLNISYSQANGLVKGAVTTNQNANVTQADPNAGKAADYEVDGNIFKQIFAGIFIAIIRVFSLFIFIGVSLISWTLSPDFLLIIKNDGIYTGWSTVRDFLNIFFIFFLLYSAFCTVFQVSRYHIRSTWVMIVVMALLVNFSWPIARVMIDVSNVTMYHLVGGASKNGDYATNTLLSKFSSESRVAELVLGKEISKVKGNQVNVYVDDAKIIPLFTSLFISVIVSAMFAFTIGFVAFLLVFRMIALAVYLVFASGGFTLAAFPSTRGIASQWWSGFTKQLIVGPVVIFAIILATTVLSAVENTKFASSGKEAAEANGVLADFLVYIVAILLIWASVLAAQRVGGEGVGLAMKAANKSRDLLKKNAIRGGKIVGRQVDSRIAGGRVAGTVSGLRQRANNISSGFDKKYKGQQEEASTKVVTAGTGVGIADDASWAKKKLGKVTGYGGDRNAPTNLENKKVAEMKKKWKDDNVDAATLANKIDGSKGAETRALVEALSSMKEGVDEDVVKKMAVKVNSNNEYEGLVKAVNKKATETGNAHVVYEERLKKISGESDSTRLGSVDQRYKEQAHEQIYKSMDAKSYAKQKSTIKNVGDGNLAYEPVVRDLYDKLNRASFARDVQNVDGETYSNLEALNDKHL